MISEPGDVRYSVVVPVYGNEATLPALLERLEVMAHRLDGHMEAVFVVDGSPDGSLVVLRRLLRSAAFPSQLVAHSRNFGSFAALRTGFAAAEGRYIAAMAADLQEPPELVEELFARLSTGDVDVAVGTRESRDDPRTSMLLSRVFWSVYRRWVHREIPAGGVDIFGCTRQVADELVALDESHSSLVGLLYWLGFRRAEVPYRRSPRTEGRSGWTFGRKLRYFLDSVYSFTDVPITLLTLVGAVGGVLTLLTGAGLVAARLTGAIQQAGYTPLMLVVLLSTFTLLFGLGVVGSYVWRTYENSKGRPAAVAMTHEKFLARNRVDN
ncbi:glycosyltransferase family 2 protein [Blastococcus saxobsidens]|uniref:Glycosyltransferase involved in cell wall biosynthesis n=1 Tax=Blastococcus saxobsidens TaxID=138336 RepID=A0A4Q7Y970_9ACTN|nr:glycosyltransferase family 2 protein [Blastococcus saxobsidens]RZU33074.1 glycosyltransferase involved in cell wall biosynthesis [Blastococcus saxobsidens]